MLLLLAAGILQGMMGRAWSAEQPKKVPVTVTADKLDYDRTNDRYVATGHVKMEKEGIRVEADEVIMDNKSGETKAEGNVFIQDQGDVTLADKMTLNLNTREGTFSKGVLFLKKENLHLKGDKIERLSETVYHIEKGVITTCDQDDWFLKADELDIDMDRYATGKGVALNIAGVPVIYTPYFLFPVRRQTGLLIPEVGYSSSEGLFADNALFWAISDFKDMTFYSDYRERIGHGTGIEYRYMNSWESRGQLYYKFWDQYHTGASRWDIKYQHQEEFAQDLSGRVDINLVSDESYYHDLERKLENRSKPYLDSNAFYVERWDTASLYLMGQYSIDLTRTNEKTVQKLPELRYTIVDATVADLLHLSFDSSAVNFTRQTDDGLRRVDFNPRIAATFGHSGLSLTPRVGIRATFYDRSAATADSTERKYLYAGADMNARVSRVYGSDGDSGIGRIRHSIEPTLSYLYIPRIEQGSIPQFDSVDSVTTSNLATLAVVNRLTAHYKESNSVGTYSTFDVLVFRLSQSYDLNMARDSAVSSPQPRSDLLGELYARTPKVFTASATGSYNTYSHVMTSHSEGVGVAFSAVSLNLSHQFLRNPETEFFIGGGGVKLGKWNLGAQWWRDVQNKKTTQEDYRMQYASQCWGIGMVYTVKPGEYQFTAMLDLKGLGGRSYGQK